MMIAARPRSKGVRSRKKKREAEELSSPSADAVSEKKTEGDGSHDSSAVEDSGLQGLLRTKEAGRGDQRDGGLDEFGNGRRLQNIEGAHEKGFDERINVG